MRSALARPVLGVLAAIVITTAMDTAGLSAFSALPLLPLFLLFAYLERSPRKNLGFIWGKPRDYVAAILYPVLVIGTIALTAGVAGAVDLSNTNWRKTGLNLLLISVSTFLVAIVTEEGFFRGWLWSSCEKANMRPNRVLLWTSVSFSLWHLSAVTLHTGFDPLPKQVPTFMINAAVVGIVWGLFRQMSGSVIVTGLSHGVWNGLAYVLFGFGSRIGALGVQNTAVYGPEVGVLGLAINSIFAAFLWASWTRARRRILARSSSAS